MNVNKEFQNVIDQHRNARLKGQILQIRNESFSAEAVVDEIL